MVSAGCFVFSMQKIQQDERKGIQDVAQTRRRHLFLQGNQRFFGKYKFPGNAGIGAQPGCGSR